MNNMKSEITARMCQSLHMLLDERMAKHNFMRQETALVYSRQVHDVHQSIDIILSAQPKDCHNAAVSIYPWLIVSMDSVNSLSLELVGGDQKLCGPLNVTLKEPISYTSPKHSEARWLIHQAELIPCVVLEIRDFLNDWTIPFLDYFTSPGALCDAQDRKDPRIVLSEHYSTHVVAALMLQNRVVDAMNFVESYFGHPGPRRRYRNMFRYLRSQHGQ